MILMKWQYNAISSDDASYYSSPQQSFKRERNRRLIVIGSLLFVVGWQFKKRLDLEPSPPNNAKYFLKILTMTISIS